MMGLLVMRRCELPRARLHSRAATLTLRFPGALRRLTLPSPASAMIGARAGASDETFVQQTAPLPSAEDELEVGNARRARRRRLRRHGDAQECEPRRTGRRDDRVALPAVAHGGPDIEIERSVLVVAEWIA